MENPGWLNIFLTVTSVVGPLIGVWLGYFFSARSQREQRKEEARVRDQEAVADEKARQRSAVSEFFREVYAAENQFEADAAAEVRDVADKNTEFLLAGKPELCGSHGSFHKNSLESLCRRRINRSQSAWAVMDLQLTDAKLRNASQSLSKLGAAIFYDFRKTYKIESVENLDDFKDEYDNYYANLKNLRDVASQRLS